jgi:hypothetical protein
VFVYDIRNNRSIGHVGGDVDPNYMDASIVLSSAKWILAELVRVFQGMVDIHQASLVVDSLVEKDVPYLWSIGENVRVLDDALPASDKVLLLAYSSSDPPEDAVLAKWIEYRNMSRFKAILRKLHSGRFIEYDSGGLVHLSPKGVQYVERQLADKLSSRLS